MFKRLLVIAFLATPFTQFCGAMEPTENKGTTENEQKFVFMPDEEKLTKLFADNGGKDFIEKTDAIKQLAGQKLFPAEIEIAKSMLLYQYANALGKTPCYLKTILTNQTAMIFESVIKEILKNFPWAKEELDLLRKEIKQLTLLNSQYKLNNPFGWNRGTQDLIDPRLLPQDSSKGWVYGEATKLERWKTFEK